MVLVPLGHRSLSSLYTPPPTPATALPTFHLPFPSPVPHFPACCEVVKSLTEPPLCQPVTYKVSVPTFQRQVEMCVNNDSLCTCKRFNNRSHLSLPTPRKVRGPAHSTPMIWEKLPMTNGRAIPIITHVLAFFISWA